MKTKTLKFFVELLLIFLVQSKQDETAFPEENSVLILTDDTFEEAAKKYDYLMVLFYAPWCGHCKKFHPEYEKAAKTLKPEELILAKVDATKETKLAQTNGVHGYPTVKLFIKGEPIDYKGGRTEKDVVDWMRKKTKPALEEYKTEKEINELIEKEKVFIMYYGDKKKVLDIFKITALKNDDLKFGYCEDEEIAKKLNEKFETIIMYKKFDEKKNILDKLTKEEINKFVEIYSIPKILEFTNKAGEILFGNHNPCVVLFRDKNSEKAKEYMDLLNKVYDKVNKKLKVVVSDIKEGLDKSVAEFIGINEKNLPCVGLLDTRSRIKKYLMEGEVNLENILSFVENWEKNKLAPYVKSEPIPEKNDGDVKILVQKIYDKEVLKNQKDVFVFFYAPWCGHCKAFHPKYEEAAKLLKAKNPNLVLAKIDATANEIESVQLKSYPTLFFYPGNAKYKAPIQFEGDRTVEGLIKFIKEHASNKIEYEEPKKEEAKKEEPKKEEAKKEEDL